MVSMKPRVTNTGSIKASQGPLIVLQILMDLHIQTPLSCHLRTSTENMISWKRDKWLQNLVRPLMSLSDSRLVHHRIKKAPLLEKFSKLTVALLKWRSGFALAMSSFSCMRIWQDILSTHYYALDWTGIHEYMAMTFRWKTFSQHFFWSFSNQTSLWVENVSEIRGMYGSMSLRHFGTLWEIDAACFDPMPPIQRNLSSTHFLEYLPLCIPAR